MHTRNTEMRKKLKRNTKIMQGHSFLLIPFHWASLCGFFVLINGWKWNNYLSCLFTLTALMPLSCWPMVITMTVMSCHLTAGSVNNCQGFLGFSPSKAKHSLWMSSISLRYSEEPWNRFKATNRKKNTFICWPQLLGNNLFSYWPGFC